MSKFNTEKSWIHSGVVFVALLAILGLATSCGGGVSGTSMSGGSPIPPITPVQPSIGSIASVVSAAVNTPYILGNTVQYYCDCTGAGQSCAVAGVTQGSDSNAGTLISPKQTIGAALAFVNGGNNRTAALCQGGSFPTGSTLYFTNTTCAAGTYCNEFREYPFKGTKAKPIIDGTGIGGNILFGSVQNVTNGGWRFMNIKLEGPNVTSSSGFYPYTWVGGTYVHDILIENVDIDAFQTGIDQENVSNTNIVVTGNHFTNNIRWGVLGAANNYNITYNSFINNGSDSTYDHAIYFATNGTNSVQNVNIIGNYMTGYSSLSTKCMGEQLVGHAAVTNLVVSGNVIIEPTNSDIGCYGMSFDNSGGSTNYAWYRNAIFSDNIIVNVGNIGMAISTCPNCVIENNLIISEGSPMIAAIKSPVLAAHAGYNDVENNVRIVNNTAYYGVNHTAGGSGFTVSTEGTGHVMANNTAVYAPKTGTFDCLVLIPSATLSDTNNNNCFSSSASNYWMNDYSVNYSLASWQSFSGFDSASSTSNPGWSFTTPFSIPTWNDSLTPAQWIGSSFIPTTSVLLGKGSHTYAPVLDFSGVIRPNPPAIGAFE